MLIIVNGLGMFRFVEMKLKSLIIAWISALQGSTLVLYSKYYRHMLANGCLLTQSTYLTRYDEKHQELQIYFSRSAFCTNMKYTIFE